MINLDIKINSDLENVSAIGVFIESFSKYIGFSDEKSYENQLALVEALNNCVEHSYNNKDNFKIRINIKYNDNKFKALIIDTGNKIPNDKLTYISEYKENLEEGNRGLFLIFSIMDNVKYYSKGKYNFLYMERKLTQ
jgi:serine/threonine-protein kinase RsbW